MILDVEGETADAAVAEDVKVEVAETKSEEATESIAAKVELSTETSAAETETENKVEDVKVACDETNQLIRSVMLRLVQKVSKTNLQLKTPSKAAFGINIGDGGSPNLTPSGDVTSETPVVILKRFTKLVKTKNDRCWKSLAIMFLTFKTKNVGSGSHFLNLKLRIAMRLVLMYRLSKNGAYSVSLYINDRATGIKERLVHETPVDKLTAAANVLAMMSSAKFADAVKAANYVKAVA